MNKQDEKMIYRLFFTAVDKQIRSKLGNEYSVETGKALKNNSVEFDTVIIRRAGEIVVPNIFVNPYYDRYLNGESIEDIADEIIRVYYGNRNRIDIESIGDCSFEHLSGCIFYKLINADLNEELLEQLPHVRKGNLALVFACLVQRGPEGIASIRIDNQLAKKWNTNAESLAKLAGENTLRLFPPRIFLLDNCNLNKLMNHGMWKSDIEDFFDTRRDDEDSAISSGIQAMYVLTNEEGVDGAACIAYRGMLERIYRHLGRGFFIIPSSVHEVLILPQSEDCEREELNRMVKEVNEKVLSKMDILSDRVYYYPEDDFEV